MIELRLYGEIIDSWVRVGSFLSFGAQAFRDIRAITSRE
jgi:hypothetical protein